MLHQKNSPLLLANMYVEEHSMSISEIRETELLHIQLFEELKKFNIVPTRCTELKDPNIQGYRLQVWCDDYSLEDLTLARLAGLI